MEDNNPGFDVWCGLDVGKQAHHACALIRKCPAFSRTTVRPKAALLLDTTRMGWWVPGLLAWRLTVLDTGPPWGCLQRDMSICWAKWSGNLLVIRRVGSRWKGFAPVEGKGPGRSDLIGP